MARTVDYRQEKIALAIKGLVEHDNVENFRNVERLRIKKLI